MAADLDNRLLAAHAAGDEQELVALYTEAADLFEAEGDVDAACFYLTQAYVFALQTGAADAPALQQRLFEHGREQPPAESAGD